MWKGSEVTGIRYVDSRNSHIYHTADRKGKAYLCDCARMIKITDHKYIDPGNIKYKRSTRSKRWGL